MLSTTTRRALLLLIAALVAAPARAENVLDHLPPDALGFALVHNLSAANAKIEKMLKIFAGLSESAPPRRWPSSRPPPASARGSTSKATPRWRSWPARTAPPTPGRSCWRP